MQGKPKFELTYNAAKVREVLRAARERRGVKALAGLALKVPLRSGVLARIGYVKGGA